MHVEVISEVLLFRRFHGQNMNLRMRPEKHPLPRSLKAKLDRERASGGDKEATS